MPHLNPNAIGIDAPDIGILKNDSFPGHKVRHNRRCERFAPTLGFDPLGRFVKREHSLHAPSLSLALCRTLASIGDW